MRTKILMGIFVTSSLASVVFFANWNMRLQREQMSCQLALEGTRGQLLVISAQRDWYKRHMIPSTVIEIRK